MSIFASWFSPITQQDHTNIIKITNKRTTMKTTNETRRRVMKMAHVRRNVDVKLFGRTDGDFADYLRGAGPLFILS